VQVSRETETIADAVVEQWFGPAAALARRYVEVLSTDGVRRGLLGPREVPRIWSRHVLNCVVIHPLVAQHSTVGDLGSGAGLPGIVLALARPDLTVTLIEPLLRRSAFLEAVAASLELTNVTVVRARAEDLAGTRAYDVVVARAVAPLDRLAGWALPLCVPGGELVALKGSSVQDEVSRAGPTLARLHAGPVRIESYGVGVVEPPTTVVRIGSNAPTATQRGSS
jgi:16S rRNA (guanine527-N7)-methyltransferase